MNEDPLPLQEFDQDYVLSAKMALALICFVTTFAGIFLFVTIVFAQYTMGGII